MVALSLAIVDRAEPFEIDVPTSTESDKILVRDIRDALREACIDTSVTDGWKISSIANRKALLKDLSKFENLIADFRIADDKKPAAFAAWMREALAGGNRG